MSALNLEGNNSAENSCLDKENKMIYYKKRSGTSGVSGQLYETKLTSLILFRMMHDDEIEDFYIGANVDGLGEFDDICFKLKTIHNDKPIAVFLQAKHREDENRAFIMTKSDLTKYFLSYLKIRNKFRVDCTSVCFNASYDEVECVYVFYTNARDQMNKTQVKNNVIDKVNNIIKTGDDAFQLSFTHDDITLINNIILHEKINKLATLVANFVINNERNYKNIMSEELIQMYHVILSQNVIHVGEMTTEGYRIGQFQSEFFQSTYQHVNQHMLVLKEALILELIKENSLNEEEIKKYLSLMFFEPHYINISKLIGCVITYKNNRFEFVDKRMYDDTQLKEQLDKVNVPHSVVRRAIITAVKLKICSYAFKLPPTFGNTDIILTGNDLKKDKRISYLAIKLISLLKMSNEIDINNETINVVNMDENFTDKGFLKANGGIASAIGNLLVLDDRTKLLMFNTDDNLKGHAKTLLNKVKSGVEDLERYRFDIKVQHFPRLTFDCNEHDKILINDFTNKIIFYTNQAKQSEVEDLLKTEINQTQKADHYHFQIKSDAIFMKYHDEIQKWWMKKQTSEYLTKTCTILQNPMKCFIKNPLLSIANALSNNNIFKNDVIFHTEYANLLNLNEMNLKTNMIVSEVISMSVIKLMHIFKNNDYIILDLNYILNLSKDDCVQLVVEMKSNNETVYILTCNKISDSFKLNLAMKDILRLDLKRLIIVTNENSAQALKNCFRNNELDIIYDSINLAHLTQESQNRILDNTYALFQGTQVSLNFLLDDHSKKFIKGEQMNKILNKENIELGRNLANSNYEEIKHFYVSRNVLKKYVFERNNDYLEYSYDSDDTINTYEEKIRLETFYDIDNSTVLITAEPGMGKSSLLTHLSMKTKTLDPKLWIVRINLLDYSSYFYQWKKKMTNIDILEALKFICMTLYNGKNNVFGDKKIVLKNENEEITVQYTEVVEPTILFELSMFLHYHNNYKIIFLFDGFDEICPHYEDEVIQMLKVIRDSSNRKHRIWVTSRTYNTILKRLEKDFGEPYALQPFTSEDQEMFIERFLQLKLPLIDLNSEEINKINSFITFMEETNSWRPEEEFSTLHKCRSLPLHTVYLDAAQYFKNEIRNVLYLEDKDKYIRTWDINVKAMKIVRQYNGVKGDMYNMHEFIAIPLHIYMIADFFVNEIKNTNVTLWDLNVNTFVIYERFIETKLRKIRFEDKNRMDLYKPDVQFTFERERKEFVDKHKKLAAYAIFYHNTDTLFSETELNDIKKSVNSIKDGEEKTGIVYDVVDDKPRFIHLTFAEYFAVEYICDLIKNEQSESKIKELLGFILNDMFFGNNVGVLNILDDKLIMDEKLNDIIRMDSNRKLICDLLMEQSEERMEHVYNNGDVYLEKKYYSSLQKSVTESLSNLTSLFLSTLEFINEDNIEHLISVVAENSIMMEAVILKNFEFTDAVLNTVRKIDDTKLIDLFKKLRMYDVKCEGTNEEIITRFRTSVYKDLNSRELYDHPFQLLEAASMYLKYYD